MSGGSRTDTDAAFAAADQMKGLPAIEAAKKAVEARKEGDTLTAEMLNLQPQLNQAKLALSVAQIKETEANAVAMATSSASDRGKAAEKAAQDSAAALRADVKKTLDDELQPKFAEFTKLAADMNKDVDEAASMGGSAQTAFKDAGTQLQAQQTKIRNEVKDPSDPLLKIVNMPELKQILDLQQASAAEEVGRAYLLASLAERYRTIANSAMAASREAAGLSAAGPTTGPTADDFAGKAKIAFTNANALADKTAKAISDTVDNTNKPARAVKWLAYSISAEGWQGLYMLSNAKSDLDQAVDSEKKAKTMNPFLTLNVGAEGTTSSQP